LLPQQLVNILSVFLLTFFLVRPSSIVSIVYINATRFRLFDFMIGTGFRSRAFFVEFGVLN